ncbi:Crp/Fnr family transcriptional regulator [Tenacibaculum sp. IB213877]|uniref:Crp/Fnr family transcriptional regulator n=1 Tax=Tenacibaculum sp. IB213877 TaxID=3097351 RepID=UPI002A5A2C97|nr:Crp/Fnr family transcriptional regulator [Tenacibaculum sp. IB213877]MDY0781168.1 Crp/Fnr family transcriptional regulator [Tenacibaculum sp. IB213877]
MGEIKDIAMRYLTSYSNDVSEKSINQFKSLIHKEKYSKGDIIVDYGKTTRNFYIIKSGIAGCFIKNEEGNEFIRTLYRTNKALGSLTSLIKKEVSNASYVCLTDCEVYKGDFYEFINLTEQNSELLGVYSKILEQVYIRSEKRIDELCLFDATKRYLLLKQEIQEIENLLPQYQIANYLNITPVQLSRIRKKIFS